MDGESYRVWFPPWPPSTTAASMHTTTTTTMGSAVFSRMAFSVGALAWPNPSYAALDAFAGAVDEVSCLAFPPSPPSPRLSDLVGGKTKKASRCSHFPPDALSHERRWETQTTRQKKKKKKAEAADEEEWKKRREPAPLWWTPVASIAWLPQASAAVLAVGTAASNSSKPSSG